MGTERLQIRLREAGLRLTQPRLAVLQTLDQPGTHLDSDTIVKEATKILPTLSRQAVFDNLNTLVAAKIIRRIEPAGRPALYETRVGDNHHHLVCRLCHATVDINCAVGHTPCLQPDQSHGFLIDEAEVVFWGLCPQCQISSKLQNTSKAN